MASLKFSPTNPIQDSVISKSGTGNILSVNDFKIRGQRIVNLVAFSLLSISAAIVLVSYSVFLTTIIPPLDLFETGNWWTFLVLLISCIITIILSGFGLWKTLTVQRGLGSLAAIFIQIMLCLYALSPVLTVGFGAAEITQNRRGHQKVTHFGLYIISVCGNATSESEYVETTGISTISEIDGEKCVASRSLRIGIYCMYIWAAELLVIILALYISLLVCKGTCRQKNCRKRKK